MATNNIFRIILDFCHFAFILDPMFECSTKYEYGYLMLKAGRKGFIMKIMIVESDWRFAAQAIRYFESRGHLVVQETPRGAAGHARSWQPDLVILAAEYSSEEVLNSLRALRVRPAVLISEHMSNYKRAWAAWQRGGDELLMKPIFKASELQEAVVIALENARLNSNTSQRHLAAATA